MKSGPCRNKIPRDFPALSTLPPPFVVITRSKKKKIALLIALTMANEIGFFELNTGAKIPSIGLGTWQAAPGVVGDAVAAAVKVRF